MMILPILLLLECISTIDADWYFKARFHYTGMLICPTAPSVNNATIWLREENDILGGFSTFDDTLSEQPVTVIVGQGFAIDGKIDHPAYEGKYREPYLVIRHYCAKDGQPTTIPIISYYLLPLVSALQKEVIYDAGPINLVLDAELTIDRRAGTGDDHVGVY